MTAPATTRTATTPAAGDVLLVLATSPGEGVSAVRATWGVNRATAARWIRDASTDPAYADEPTARRWAYYAAILDGRPVPGRGYHRPPITGTPIPDLDEHDLNAPVDQPDPVTALVDRDLERRGDQR